MFFAALPDPHCWRWDAQGCWWCSRRGHCNDTRICTEASHSWWNICYTKRIQFSSIWNKERTGQVTSIWHNQSISFHLLSNIIINGLWCQRLMAILKVWNWSRTLYSLPIRPLIQQIYDKFIHFYRPPLRQFMMDGDFFVAAALSTTLTKLALRYVSLTQDQRRQNVSNNSLIVWQTILIPDTTRLDRHLYFISEIDNYLFIS